MSDFWLGVAQAVIGSGLGFLLGIGAFHYQQHRQSKNQAKEGWRAALDALIRLNAAACINIETLANTKLQFGNDLLAEVKEMKKKFQRESTVHRNPVVPKSCSR